MLHTYHRELERVRLRAMLAIERIGAGETSAGAAERIAQELARVEAAVAAERPGSRAADLARRLGLADDEVDLLWTAVAVAADPRMQPHARVLGGGEARRGLSLAT